jgi:hypothetical protein
MLVDWQLIEFNVLQLQDEFMSLHQFNHPRRSSLKCGSYIYVDIIEHAELKQCSVMCAIIIVLGCDEDRQRRLHLEKTGNFAAAFLRISSLRMGDARIMATAHKNFGSSALNAKNKFRDYILWENLRRAFLSLLLVSPRSE